MVDQKPKNQFNILSNRKATTHGDYYTGTLNLSNMSSVLIDHDTANIDLGLIHAKSKIERGIKFTADQAEVAEGKTYYVVWVAIGQNEKGSYYAGVTACPMVIDHEIRKGWKNLAFHVNRMDDALKRRIKVSELGEVEKEALKALFIDHDQEMWENSSDELKDALSNS
ncbi:YwhD family protein [Baia soyae]|uniref:YwhD-like protein n=1 Tax=Baia soyae TaxID=1544746 RepID=A0A4R2S1Q8_9BACL|nr:YwhD-like protein [Baia soyae]